MRDSLNKEHKSGDLKPIELFVPKCTDLGLIGQD